MSNVDELYIDVWADRDQEMFETWQKEEWQKAQEAKESKRGFDINDGLLWDENRWQQQKQQNNKQDDDWFKSVNYSDIK